jgi:hypothetical protein
MAGLKREARLRAYDPAVQLLATRHSYPTLPPRGKSAETFPQNHGGRHFAGTARRRIIAAKKPCLAARKKRATVLPAVRLNAITCG